MTSYSSVTGLYTYFISTALYKIWPSLSLSYISSHLQTQFQTNIIPSKQKSPAALKCSTTPKRENIQPQTETRTISVLKSIRVTNSRLNLARILDHYISHLNVSLHFFQQGLETHNICHYVPSRSKKKRTKENKMKKNVKKNNNNKKRKKVP